MQKSKKKKQIGRSKGEKISEKKNNAKIGENKMDNSREKKY